MQENVFSRVQEAENRIDTHTLASAQGLALETEHTIPNDGYVRVFCNSASTRVAFRSGDYNLAIMYGATNGVGQCIYVKKGMKVKLSVINGNASDASLNYFPLS